MLGGVEAAGVRLPNTLEHGFIRFASTIGTGAAAATGSGTGSATSCGIGSGGGAAVLAACGLSDLRTCSDITPLSRPASIFCLFLNTRCIYNRC